MLSILGTDPVTSEKICGWQAGVSTVVMIEWVCKLGKLRAICNKLLQFRRIAVGTVLPLLLYRIGFDILTCVLLTSYRKRRSRIDGGSFNHLYRCFPINSGFL